MSRNRQYYRTVSLNPVYGSEDQGMHTLTYTLLLRLSFSVEYFVFLEGCENFVSLDGIWKLRHPHCLFPVNAEVSGLPTINYPNVCTEEPESQASAFCAEHSQLAKERNIPTNLRDFIHDYCKVPRNPGGIYALINYFNFWCWHLFYHLNDMFHVSLSFE